MKHYLVYLLLIIPCYGYSQLVLSPAIELMGVFKKSENISPLDAYYLVGPAGQLSRKTEGRRLQPNIQTGFCWVKSETFSRVYSIPVTAGFDYQFEPDKVYGITAAAGPRLLFSDDAHRTVLHLSFRAGLYYALFNSIIMKYGYERIGNSNLLFAQLVFYGFPLSKKKEKDK